MSRKMGLYLWDYFSGLKRYCRFSAIHLCILDTLKQNMFGLNSGILNTLIYKCKLDLT